MKIKQTILALALVIGISGFFISPTVFAENCGDYSTSILPCNKVCLDGVAPVNGKCSDGSAPNGIWGILLLVINILTAGIGVAAVGGIVYGSILYTSAGGDAANVKKAKDIIVNVVIGLVAYAVMYSFLNYIIPGGLFT